VSRLDHVSKRPSSVEQAVCVAEQSPAVEATFVSPSQFITATPEGVLTVWRIRNTTSSAVWSDSTKLVPSTMLRGHQDVVTGLFASPAWSVLVSTSEDGSAIVWDTNRYKFLRRLAVQPEEPVRSAAIDDATVSITFAATPVLLNNPQSNNTGAYCASMRRPHSRLHPERISDCFS
jgi:WD40 repeat protein